MHVKDEEIEIEKNKRDEKEIKKGRKSYTALPLYPQKKKKDTDGGKTGPFFIIATNFHEASMAYGLLFSSFVAKSHNFLNRKFQRIFFPSFDILVRD